MILKTVILSVMMLLSSVYAQEKLDAITTIDGKTYTKVEVVQKTPAGISIRHESGLARIWFKDLSPESIKALGGYDPKAADAYQKELQEKEAAADAAMDAAIAKMNKEAKTPEQKLQAIEKQIQNDKTISPEEKAKRRELAIGKLKKVQLQKGKLESGKLEPSK